MPVGVRWCPNYQASISAGQVKNSIFIWILKAGVSSPWHWVRFCFVFLRSYSFIFRERGKVGEREGEKHRCVRVAPIGCLLHVPQAGTKPATQVCALTRNQTSDLLLCRMTPNQLIHTGQDWASTCYTVAQIPHRYGRLFITVPGSFLALRIQMLFNFFHVHEFSSRMLLRENLYRIPVVYILYIGFVCSCLS